MTARETTSVAAGWTTVSILVAIIAVFIVHGGYFILTLAPLRHEQVYMAIASGRTWGDIPAYAALLSAWSIGSGFDLMVSRVLSLLWGVGGIVFAYRIGRRLTADAPSGAAFTLPFVLFPPLVATYSTVGPHSLFAMLLLAALDSLQRARNIISRGRQAALAGQAAACAVLAAIISPLGFIVAPLWLMATALLVGLGWAWAMSVLAAIGMAAVVFGLGGFVSMPGETELPIAADATILTTLVLPYAMLAVGSGLSMATLWSPTVRSVTGRGGATLAVLGLLVAGSILSLSAQFGWMKLGQLLTSAGYVFPLAIFATWPLIIWVRRVMPGVTSVWAWIVFPVVMYSCFWVILGPIDLDRFPYSHRLETKVLTRS